MAPLFLLLALSGQANAVEPVAEAAPQTAPVPRGNERVAALLEQAREHMSELEYDRAAPLLTEVIVDAEASTPQQREARQLLAHVEVVRGFNAEARAHYTWLLEQDPAFELGPDEPPKVRGFFRLVKEQFTRERMKEEELRDVAEEGKKEVRREAERKKAELEAAIPRPGGSGPDRQGDSVLPPPDAGEASLLGAGLAGCGCSAGSAAGVLLPFLAVAVTSPGAAPGAALCCGLTCGAVAPAIQGLGMVLLGDTLGGGRSRWAYLFTVLASYGSFLGCMAGAFLPIIGTVLGVQFAIAQGLFAPAPGQDADDISGLAALVVTLGLGLLFAVLQPVVPLVVYGLFGNDAPPLDGDRAPELLDEAGDEEGDLDRLNDGQPRRWKRPQRRRRGAMMRPAPRAVMAF